MDRNRIKRIITVYVPGHLCNLRCSYCYVTECLKYSMDGHAQFNYSVEHMIKAFEPARLGGIAYIVVIGEGETLFPPEVIPFVKGLLHQGHVVEVVTNNTLDDRIGQLLDIPQEDLKHLIVKCSLHWLELKRLNKVNSYFENIRRIVAAGASAYPFLVICEEYMPFLDEICDVCEKELGELPACTPCVTAETPEQFLEKGGAGTNPPCTTEFVEQINKRLHSKLFEQSVRFLDIDVRKVFCYAGAWSYVVQMGTGRLCKCHNVLTDINFFENIDQPVECAPVGCECGIASCSLQYCFYGFGLIPEVSNVPTYTEMLCEGSNLFNPEIKQLLNSRISDHEKIFTKEEENTFLMDVIHCKNLQIEELSQRMTKEQYAAVKATEAEKQRRLYVERLLGLVDEDRLSYEELSFVTYDTMMYLKYVCDTMPDGSVMYGHIWEKITRGLFSYHTYVEPNYFYHADNILEVEQIQGLSVVTLVSEYENAEQMKRSMKEGDYVACARIQCTQMQTFCVEKGLSDGD